MFQIRLFSLVALFGLFSCSPTLPEDVSTAYNNLPEALDFNIHVKPILSDKCFLCHGPDKAKQKAGLRLDIEEYAKSELPENPGAYAISPGSLKHSELYHRIISNDQEILMPSPESNLSLTAYEKAVIVKWIEDGAEYKPHWAFIPPAKPVPPVVTNGKVNNPIDNFIIHKLKQNGLKSANEAEKEVLLRRLSLDLTGLPPTIEEIDGFVNDHTEDAYEKQVDRLLASSHYGEKMAADWMDLARFADTHGYTVDRYRDASPWRDWVIKSFNENIPYDQFVTWQLAGDLLENPTKDQMIATGFNRLHQQNMEGGIVDEEFRVAYVSDRTDVLGQGFMALTLGCAKCHDHKYDPVSQKEYYQLYSFFNNVNEAGQISFNSDDIPVPTMLLPTEEQEEIIAYLEKTVEEQEIRVTSTLSKEQSRFQNWLEAGGYQSLKPEIPQKELMGYFQLNGVLNNATSPFQTAKMERQGSKEEFPLFTEGLFNKGLKLNGDAWLDLDRIGIFKRNESFSIGLWVNVPENIKEGVIFHKNNGSRLFNYKGYHLNIRENYIEVMLAHTWPDNSLVKVSTVQLPKEEWVHLMITYDGSSQADGLTLYMNGEALKTVTEFDNLYKDIIYHSVEKGEYHKNEPGLQIGARWRGKGIGGAVVDEILVYGRELSPVEVLMIGAKEKLKSLASTPINSMTNQQLAQLKDYYIKHFSSDYESSQKLLESSRGVLVDSIQNVKEVMVMKEMSGRRKAYVLERGLYDTYGEEVFPNTPESILKWKDEFPKNRLGLSQWLFDEKHPLTARVAVNRYWQQYFGRGIVRTTEDFGNQGELPSHPELLDWLAVHFMESGWNIRALQKLIVMSATYRQSSITTEELRDKDPQNILLARGPTNRMSSEMLRDNALLASGLLNDEIGGKSIKPYQPEGLWSMNSGTYEQDSGANLYRRSLYVFWKRTVPHPTLATFDQPERVECTVKRQKTNTPLQALVLLNDPTFIEASRAIGETITKHESSRKGIIEAYQRLTGIQPKPTEVELLVKVQEEEYTKFANDKERSKGWLNSGEYLIDPSLDADLVAANTIVASIIINSDACITKR